MSFKFEKLDVWQLSVEYIDIIYEIASQLPRSEEYNLKSQIFRAATSVSLNIAEGSTGQTDAEQGRFVGLAIRSLKETIACLHLIRRREAIPNPQLLDKAYSQAEQLAVNCKHSVMRSIQKENGRERNLENIVLLSQMSSTNSQQPSIVCRLFSAVSFPTMEDLQSEPHP